MTPRTRLLVPLFALAAFASACGSDDTTTVAGSAGDTPGADSAEAELEEGADRPAEPLAVGEVVISGDPLPPFTDSGDPSIGSPSPLATSVDFSGQTTEIAADGRPKVLVFVAHWCPHCQDEVPRLTQWLDEGKKPDGVDFITVVTAIDPSASNYPPSAWLIDDEHLDTPFLIDDEANTLAGAYGLSAFPYWVVVDAGGQIVRRASGGLGTEGFEAMATAALTGEAA